MAVAGPQVGETQAGWSVDLQAVQHTPPEIEAGFLYSVKSLPDESEIGSVLIYERREHGEVKVEGRTSEPSETGEGPQTGRLRATFKGELPPEDDVRAEIVNNVVRLMIGWKEA